MTAKEQERLRALIDDLDQAKISEAVHEGAPAYFNLDDYEIASEMIFKLMEAYLLDDLDEYEIVSMEEKKSILFEGCSEPTSLIIDVLLHDRKKDELVAVDWKTTMGELDPRWAQRKIDSHQWKTYLHAVAADRFEYRGVSSKSKTRTIPLGRYPALDVDVLRYYAQVNRMRSSLIGEAPWPQNAPQACYAFGRWCEFVGDCRDHKYPRDILVPKSISNSAAESFLLCPERHRREELIKIGGGQGKESPANFNRDLGSAVHRGITAVYRQAFNYVPAILNAN